MFEVLVIDCGRKKHEISSIETEYNSLDMFIFLEFLLTTKLLS